MSDPLRVLIVEDLEADALLVERELRRGGFSPVCRRVESAEGMTEALTSEPWDVIISDHGMPGFSAPAALATLQGLKLDVPFIIVSGSIGEELAVDAMRSGAADFILKGALMKLPAAVTPELRDAAERRTRHETERRLRESEERFRLLVEQVPGITYEAEYDAVFRPIFVSRQILSLSGFQPAQWLSAGDFWTEHIHQEDRARVEGERRRAREAGSPFSSSYRIVGKDGRVNWWQDCAKISPGPAGAPAVFRGVVVDVTEQVR